MKFVWLPTETYLLKKLLRKINCFFYPYVCAGCAGLTTADPEFSITQAMREAQATHHCCVGDRTDRNAQHRAIRSPVMAAFSIEAIRYLKCQRILCMFLGNNNSMFPKMDINSESIANALLALLIAMRVLWRMLLSSSSFRQVA